jgi:alkyl sulfatase BDS1-like metallo-beta-lactamase superfamily hydrolase
MTLQQVFDLLAVKIDGPAATAIGHLAIDWRLPDVDEVARVELSNGTLHTTPGRTHAAPDATVTCDRSALDEMVATGGTLAGLVDAGTVTIDGDADRVLALWDTLTDFPLFYAIIEP